VFPRGTPAAVNSTFIFGKYFFRNPLQPNESCAFYVPTPQPEAMEMRVFFDRSLIPSFDDIGALAALGLFLATAYLWLGVLAS
jgi:hypothetical protein